MGKKGKGFGKGKGREVNKDTEGKKVAMEENKTSMRTEGWKNGNKPERLRRNVE